VVTFAGMAVNLCLGILYAWSVWKKVLIATKDHPAGSAMEGLNEGWVYLTDAQATWAYALCGFVFALAMIPGGRIQDRFGPKVGATLGGMFLASGCIVAGLMKSYLGLIVGFGLLGGIGMGLGYAAATPAAVKWFGPHQRGLIVGIVVGGYGGAAIYISPLANWLIEQYGLSGSFLTLGILFAAVVIVAGQLLSWPPEDYVPPGPAAAPESVPPASAETKPAAEAKPAAPPSDWSALEMLRAWQFYALVFLFIGSAQSGVLVIANATPLLAEAAKKAIPFLAANAWILAAYGGLVNALGRVGTGFYSDRIGRTNAYLINGALAAACMFAMPWIIAAAGMSVGTIVLFFVAVGIAYWQYGGGLALLPAFTADYFGSKNLGFNYGLVFLGWGIAFFMPQAAGYIKDATGSLDNAFYLSGGLLVAAMVVCLLLRRPVHAND
jgi:OFA family oxalate/formate antiporter-like MFS transporter